MWNSVSVVLYSTWVNCSTVAFEVNDQDRSYLSSVFLRVSSLSHVRLFVIPWTVAYKAPLSMEFSRQEYWSELPLPSSGDLPNSGIEPGYPSLQADTLPSEPPGKP